MNKSTLDQSGSTLGTQKGIGSFSKEGRDERGRKIIATASLCSFVTLFVVLNMIPFFVTWMMDNEIRLSNVIQSAYTVVLLVADVAILIVRKLKIN